MHVELIGDPGRLAEIEGSWQGLLAQSGFHEIFATPSWTQAWFECVGGPAGRRLAAVALWEGEQLAALFMLQRSRRLGLEVLEFTGYPRHADRMDVAVDPARQDEAFGAFAAWLAALDDWDVLSLRCFGAATDQPEAMAAALAAAGLKHLVRPDAATYHIDLAPFADVESYLAQVRSGRTRKALRRHARRLAETHGAAWKYHRELDESLLKEMVELDTGRSLRGAQERAFFGEAANLDFVRSLMRRQAGQDFWRVTALWAGDRLLAYDLSFQHLGRRLSYQTAFDRSLVGFGAGNLTLIEAIGAAIAEGCREFDFLAGDEGYKENWCHDARRCRWVLAFSGSPRSQGAYAYQRWLKPLRARMGQGRLGALVPRRLRDRFDV